MMSREKPLLVLIVVVVLAVVSGGCWRQRGVQEGEAPVIEETTRAGLAPEGTPKTTLPPGVNFSEEGNILNWDAATETYTDEWTFLYEKPGNPALSVKLAFDENSICALNKGEGPCDRSQLNNGDRVELWGNRVGDQVTVVRLKRLPE